MFGLMVCGDSGHTVDPGGKAWWQGVKGHSVFVTRKQETDSKGGWDIKLQGLLPSTFFIKVSNPSNQRYYLGPTIQNRVWPRDGHKHACFRSFSLGWELDFQTLAHLENKM